MKLIPLTWKSLRNRWATISLTVFAIACSVTFALETHRVIEVIRAMDLDIIINQSGLLSTYSNNSIRIPILITTRISAQTNGYRINYVWGII